MSTARSACDSLACNCVRLGKVLLGVMSLFVGIALVFTLWLMPFGLLLALLGAAFVSTGSIQ